MKTIIAGSRGITDLAVVEKAMERCEWVASCSCVVSGKARGVDTLGELWARSRHIPVIDFPADWTRYGKRAGYLRNQHMADYSDALVAIWDGKSLGTKHMIEIAMKQGLEVSIYYPGMVAPPEFKL